MEWKIDYMRLFVEAIVKIDASRWTRNDGDDGEPFVCKNDESFDSDLLNINGQNQTFIIF